MPDLRSLLERESLTVEPPDGFERLVHRRNLRRRNRRIGTAVVALALAAAAIGLVVRAFAETQTDVPASVTFACPPGSTPDEPGPLEQARPGGFVKMAFDRDAGRIVAFDPRSVGDPVVNVWTFDVCTNRWARSGVSWERFGGGRAGGLQAVYDEDSDLTVAIAGDGSVVAYDAETDTLSEREHARAVPPLRLVYDAASGLVLAWSLADDPAELWSYDVETDAWARVPEEGPSLGATSDHVLLAYDRSARLLVVFHGDSCSGCPVGDVTRVFDIAAGSWRGWLETGTAPAPDVNTGYFASGAEIAYDESAQRTVVFSDGKVVAYDAAARRWETRYGDLPRSSYVYGVVGRLGHAIVYDPVNERIVVYGGSVRTRDRWVGKADDVWAFDLSTDTWIQLLAPSQPYPEGTDVTP